MSPPCSVSSFIDWLLMKVKPWGRGKLPNKTEHNTKGPEHVRMSESHPPPRNSLGEQEISFYEA